MNQKQLVGEKAATFFENNTVVGLGTGSTASYMVKALARRVKDEGLSVVCVPTSSVTRDLALDLGLNVKDLSEVDEIDLTIDGADEISADFQGTKGGGGALLYEKIVASYSKKNIWIVDDSKIVTKLGIFPLPVEVIPFGSEHLFEKFKKAGYKPEYRLKDAGNKFKTDAGNIIIDLHLTEINNPKQFAQELINEVGVVEHGLFIDIVDQVIVGNDEGHVQILDVK